MKKKEKTYLMDVYNNNFEIGDGDKQIDEGTYEVDKVYDSSGIVFLSEWFFDEKVHEYTGLNNSFFQFDDTIPTQYNFPDSNQSLNEAIKEFHIKEGFSCNNSEIFITEGSTPMIASMVIFAKTYGFERIYSISPLYFNIFKVADLIDIPITPINRTLTVCNEELELPSEKSILFITDPIWSIGQHHPYPIMDKLKEWQEKTGSLIFVDESFAYTDWYSAKKTEPSSILNPGLTFRLICPTKTLCLNGLRFSYLICPDEFKKELSRITCCTIGSSSHYSFVLRPKIFEKMIEESINPIGLFSKERFNVIKGLLEKNNIKYFKPDCGFFMFVNIVDFFKRNNLNSRYMWIPNKGLDIFDKNLSGYVKLNLIMRGTSFSRFKSDLDKNASRKN